MGAQRFRDDDPMLDDRATGVLLLCVVVVAACRSTMLAVETEVLCSVLQRRGIGQFLAGRVTSWSQVLWWTASSPLLEGWSRFMP